MNVFLLLIFLNCNILYSKSFYIEKAIGNNLFDYNLRTNKKIFVTNLIEWNLKNLVIWEEIVFEVFESSWVKSYKWLKNFIKTEFFGIPTCIFDNHNHAFFFWNQAFFDWIINFGTTLVHIDEHADTRIPDETLEIDYLDFSRKDEFLEKIFHHTNYSLNVGNYIIPAINSWLVNKLVSVTWEFELLQNKDFYKSSQDYILNLDMDFFSPGMDYVDYNLKKDFILNLAKNAKLITIATSPFFIEQERAILILRDLFQ